MALRSSRFANYLCCCHNPRLSSSSFHPHESATCRTSVRYATTSSRPPSIPKPQLDIKHIRENPGLYEINCKQRNYAYLEKASWRILDLHQQWLKIVKE